MGKLPQVNFARSKSINDQQNFLVSINILALAQVRCFTYFKHKPDFRKLDFYCDHSLKNRENMMKNVWLKKNVIVHASALISSMRVPTARETTIHIEIAGNTDTSIHEPPCPSDKYLHTRLAAPYYHGYLASIDNSYRKTLMCTLTHLSPTRRIWSCHSISSRRIKFP